MILARCRRQATAVQARLPSSTSSFTPKSTFPSKPFRRRIHRLPQLEHGESFEQHGIGRMVSAGGYNMAWTKHQAHLVERLNHFTKDTPDEDKSTKELTIMHARTPSRAALFNHASMAWNTHFVMQSLLPNSSPSKPIPPRLADKLTACFSSVDSFKATFLMTANAMFGPGFVWLVKNTHARAPSPLGDPQYLILCTYIAGSPLPGAHFRRQPKDLNTENPADGYGYPGVQDGNTASSDFPPGGPESKIRRHAGSHGDSSGTLESKRQLGGADLEVVLGVCTWQHFYLHDHGPDGKMEYLEGWWDRVDWDKVERDANIDAVSVGSMFGGRMF